MVLPKHDVSHKEAGVQIERGVEDPSLKTGFRNKMTGVKYYNSGIQTDPKPIPDHSSDRTSQETQTVPIKNGLAQTSIDASTQMDGIGVYMSKAGAKFVKPKNYKSHEEMEQDRIKAVVTIQKYVRRWISISYVEKLRQMRDERLKWEAEEEENLLREKRRRITSEYERRMNPRTKEDFDLLYNLLEKWKSEQVERIREESVVDQKAHLYELNLQHVALIQSIDRRRVAVTREHKMDSKRRMFDKAAEPIRWKISTGGVCLVDNPYTIRARDLNNIYTSLNLKYLTNNERLDVLLTTKKTVSEGNSKLGREICDLADREAALMLRGLDVRKLEGLRLRISNLFARFLENPLFNPRITEFSKGLHEESYVENLFCCGNCGKYGNSSEFVTSNVSDSITKCIKCTRIANHATKRVYLSHYSAMMKELKEQEEGHAGDSKIVHIIKECDFRHLIDNIWQSQSFFSGHKDILDLCTVRWDERFEWSPWNCLVITKHEAISHRRVKDIELSYSPEIVDKVRYKHIVALHHFRKLPEMEKHVESSRYSNISGVLTIGGKSLATQTN